MGVQRPGERPQRLDRDPGHRVRRGDQAVGQPPGWQVDHDIVDGHAVGPLEHVQGHDVDAGRAERRGDGAQGAGLVGHHQAQEIGHDSSGGVPWPPSGARRERASGGEKGVLLPSIVR
jgi:hypothetical protein